MWFSVFMMSANVNVVQFVMIDKVFNYHGQFSGIRMHLNTNSVNDTFIFKGKNLD